MHSIEGALRMTDEINAQFGFERAFGKTNDNADADTKIIKFGISFNSDGTTTFFCKIRGLRCSFSFHASRKPMIFLYMIHPP